MICSNREKFVPLWDVWIHILGFEAECACWRAARCAAPTAETWQARAARRVVAPCKRGWREPAPSSAPFGGSFPYPLCPFGTTSLPLLAFGHFPLTGGIGPLTRGVGPLWGEGSWAVQIGRDSFFCGTFGYIYWKLGQSAPVGGGRVWGPPLREPSKSGGGKPPPYGFPEIVLKLGRGAPWGSRRGHAPGSQRAGEGTRPYSVFTNGSTYRKRDRSGTCPLKHRGEAELRTKFLCLLSFSKKGGDPAPPRRVRFLI